MKRFLKKTGILALLLCIMAMIASCTHRPNRNLAIDRDSAVVACYIQKTVNPDFSSVEEVKAFHSKLINEFAADETFRSMSPEIISKVMEVCLKRSPIVSKMDIVQEYREHGQIYDTITSSTTQLPTTSDDTCTTAVEGQRVTEVSYTPTGDSVNGQPTYIRTEKHG